MFARLTSHPGLPSLLCCLLPLVWLWYSLIDCLRIEWTLNPQYGYGWAVPFLCAYLVWQKTQKAVIQNPKTDIPSQKPKAEVTPSAFGFWLLLGCALLYAPTRLIQMANPDWRLVSWALALEVSGLTLLMLRLGVSTLPGFHVSALAFPIGYFLVAVPWPTMVEVPLVQALTRANAGVTVAVVSLLGVPAMQHGNVIEIANGLVGI